ncbi:aldo/keto reductase [Agarivorans aestuarii]|uniref:Aldo/keto reductase n=1 Tax=Agarivorans aestuarii TaxID=1563703 RepID=A0ABU7G3E5_9ALTE|nr:aldo/keto reductase [Agarivorans aestuarii]MEE1673831.1 aldo/keto reductase [Agarivorans aestuarii]
MELARLGNSDLEITRIGLGAWAMGGKWQWGWGAQQDEDSIATIQHALSLGINWIDTAPVYGLGHSEKVVGKAIKGLAQKPLIFSKCGFNWDAKSNIEPCLKAASVKKEVENSLKRLQVETIDLYQIHWPNPAEDIEEAWQAMAELKQQGKIRYLGVSNHTVEQMQSLQKIAPINCMQPPYSLINRDCETELLPYCQQHNAGVICYSPMGSGLLTGKMTAERIAAMGDDDWRKKADDFNEPKLSHNLKIVAALLQVAERHQVSAAEVAIAWTLKHPAITGAIVGMRSPEQANGVIKGASLKLDEQDIALIESV